MHPSSSKKGKQQVPLAPKSGWQRKSAVNGTAKWRHQTTIDSGNSPDRQVLIEDLAVKLEITINQGDDLTLLRVIHDLTAESP